ncbi:unnamed protein product [Zymoseptoria tritici ST99CH_1E4]|uniref:Septin-type G domain-containing protein n=3 Tax=Zymoseptoria tritici TaxID=1047171 RepID=F9WWM4_ZYMTI|nr:uncharacterized protein MYCGRDRAFT_107296 [Zymoseptoria tritici IPO323]EGP92280.1 hypothetical protein MYCGRDRAFT_107296 [Zymoseptoria tritici IPO323]SMR42381.1 unnamed protein product [Zymoseptoria tritici ST99CH_1E4]
MNAHSGVEPGTSKAKKAAISPLSVAGPGNSAPISFFLKSEKEMEQTTRRGRTSSRGSEALAQTSAMGDSSFGVQSLEETLRPFSTEQSPSRTDSISTDRSSNVDRTASAGRKRKPNRVHPSIRSAGQRIISSDHSSSQTSSTSPVTPEPFARTLGVRRGSAGSSANMSQPVTPTRLSPHPGSAASSTPRSTSPKSFRLSDEDETGSQALQSSNGDEGDHSLLERTPQLVMPSLAMPTRRPFTEKGKQMGRAKIMVVGSKGIGKTSLITSILRCSEDVVHVDHSATPLNIGASFATDGSEQSTFAEITASTRQYPAWRTDFESRRMLLRRNSVGEGILERNLTFIDTPSVEDDQSCRQLLEFTKDLLQRTARIESMTDSELMSLLSGDGGVQIDAVLYLFDPTPDAASPSGLSSAHQDLLQHLCKWTNVVPLVGRADTVSFEALKLRKEQINDTLRSIKAEPYHLSELSEQPDQEPFAVSSAYGDDTDVIDASILMSSEYMPPLVPSELSRVVDCLLSSENVARLRHLSAAKFLLWRQENLGYHIDFRKQAMLQSPQLGYQTTEVTSSGSCVEDPSKVLVPHSSSSYYRSASPAISDNSALSGAVIGTSTFALAKYNEEAQGTEPFRQVRLAKWAQDLQRSLNNERRRYQHMYTNPPAEWNASDDGNAHAMVTTKEGQRPPRGRLGGDLGVIDPRDPLGVLSFAQAFRRRGFFALQIVGGCGLVGAVAYWVVKNWMDVQDFFGFTQPAVMVHAIPVLPPPSSRYSTPMSWLEATPFGGLFGWSR